MDRLLSATPRIHRPRSLVERVVLGWLLLIFACSASLAENMAIIAHKTVPDSTLSRNAARLLFALRRHHWSDGQPVHVLVLADDTPAHRAFTRQVLKLYPRQLRRIWDIQTYSGTGQPPETVSSLEEMLDRVAGTPGAIGYAPRALVDSRIKIIEVK